MEQLLNVTIACIQAAYNFLWGDLIVLPLPGGGKLGLSLLVILLIPTGIYFTVRTKFLPVRLFPDMIRATAEKKNGQTTALSSLQTLIGFNGNARRDGKPRRRGGGDFRRRRRIGVLDVGNCADRFVYGVY